MNNFNIFGMLLFSIFVFSCSSKPPNCSDQSTIATVKQLILQNVLSNSLTSLYKHGDNTGDQEFIKKSIDNNFLAVSYSRPSGYDDSIKKYSCEATLVILDKMQMPINYSSQFDDKKEHIVSVGNMSEQDLVMMYLGIQSKLNENVPSNVESNDSHNLSKNGNNIDKGDSPPSSLANLFLSQHDTLKFDGTKRTENDVSGKKRDVNGDGKIDWFLSTADECGSSGCNGGYIYLGNDDSYCFAGFYGDNSFFESNQTADNLSCTSDNNHLIEIGSLKIH
jgi:hypothetical protein